MLPPTLVGGARCVGSVRVAPSSFLFRCRGDGAEHAIGLIVGTSCEIQRVGARVSTPTQSQRPQPVDHDRLAFEVLKSTEEIPISIEGVYVPIAEIANENIAAEPAKGE